MKLFLVSIFTFLTLCSFGQNLKTDTTNRSVHFGPPDRGIIRKEDEPLLLVNGKKYDISWLDDPAFDISNILSVHVLNSKNDSVKMYGKAGKNGVIIIKTKKPLPK